MSQANRWDDRNTSDYEERERAAGHREQPASALPEFRHTPAAERAPTIAAPRMQAVWPPRPAAQAEELPEEHDANTASRMSVAQLRDRIEHMEATTRAKAAEHDSVTLCHYYPGQKRPRIEGPVARNARAEKLTAYRAELARRDGSEAAATAAQDRADIAERQAHTEARRQAIANDADHAPYNTLASIAPPPARVDPADVPQFVQCHKCRLLIAQDAEGNMTPHLDNSQAECTAHPEQWTRPRTNPRWNSQTATPAPQHQPTSQAQPPAVDPAILARLRADSDDEDARRAHAAHVASAAAATDPTPAAAAACRTMQREAIATELPPVPPAAAAALAAASSKRAAVVATATAASQAAGGLSELDRAVELLVRQHSSGAVIDAAWAASARIFRPQGVRV